MTHKETSNHSAPSTAPRSGREEDRAEVEAYLSSPSWEKRLEEARKAREKILAEGEARKSAATEPTPAAPPRRLPPSPIAAAPPPAEGMIHGGFRERLERARRHREQVETPPATEEAAQAEAAGADDISGTQVSASDAGHQPRAGIRPADLGADTWAVPGTERAGKPRRRRVGLVPAVVLLALGAGAGAIGQAFYTGQVALPEEIRTLPDRFRDLRDRMLGNAPLRIGPLADVTAPRLAAPAGEDAVRAGVSLASERIAASRMPALPMPGTRGATRGSPPDVGGAAIRPAGLDFGLDQPLVAVPAAAVPDLPLAAAIAEMPGTTTRPAPEAQADAAPRDARTPVPPVTVTRVLGPAAPAPETGQATLTPTAAQPVARPEASAAPLPATPDRLTFARIEPRAVMAGDTRLQSAMPRLGSPEPENAGLNLPRVTPFSPPETTRVRPRALAGAALSDKFSATPLRLDSAVYLSARVDPVPGRGDPLAGADDIRLTLHAAPERGAAAQDRLRAFGIAPVLPAAPLSPALSRLVYYHTSDAPAARQLSEGMQVALVDMTGLRPAPAPRSFDLYLATE